MEKIGSFSGKVLDKKDNNHDNNNQASKTDSPKGVTFDDAKVADEVTSPSHNTHVDLIKDLEEIDRFINSNPPKDDSADTFTEVPECVDLFLKSFGSTISKFEKYTESRTRFGHIQEEEVSKFFEALSRISSLNNAFGQKSSPSESNDNTSWLDRTSNILHRAMSYLEEEFRNILEGNKCFNVSSKNSLKLKTRSFSRQENHQESNRCALVPEEPDELPFPGYSPEEISNMHKIATAMISSGYETECVMAYDIARRTALKEEMRKERFETVDVDDVLKMSWETLEEEIATWIKAVNRSAKVHFPGDRELCNSVFSDYPSTAKSLFSNLARTVIMLFLNFAEAVSMSRRSTEKLFKFLDMYETLRDQILPIQNETKNNNSEVEAVLKRLGEAAVNIFNELETSIRNDTGKQPVPSGAVHPLTRYTMNYLEYACEYKTTLEQVFLKHQLECESDSSNEASSSSCSSPNPFADHVTTLTEFLDANLSAKSKLYRDPSLSYIFLMNNGRYILQKAKASTHIHQLVGDTWCRMRSSELRRYHKAYQKETWVKLLGCLTQEGLQVSNGKVNKPLLKERFKNFNAMFEEIHRTQSTWVVSDEQLQSELRISISAMVIPGYRAFVGRFAQYFDGGKQTGKYVKYGPEEIENMIEQLFEGNPTSMGRRR